MKLAVYNQKADKVKDIDVADSVFNADVSDTVLAQYIYVYLSNKRQSNANTKTKAEVSGGGRKPWKQKGTGRARVGSIRSPIWKGGGRAHGPSNEINWSMKTTKNFRKAALRSALSKLNSEKRLKFIEEIKLNTKDSLTKQALDIAQAFGNPKRLTIVTLEKNNELLNAFANINKYSVKLASDVNVYDLLNGGAVLMEEKALDYIKLRSEK